MRVSVSQAKGQLLELVRRAEEGEDIELTRRGQAVARLVAVRRRELSREDRRRILAKAMEDGRARTGAGAGTRSTVLHRLRENSPTILPRQLTPPNGDEPRDRLSPPGQFDVLALLGAANQLQELTLGLGDRNTHPTLLDQLHGPKVGRSTARGNPHACSARRAA